MKRLCKLVVLGSVALGTLSGCASTQYSTYEGGGIQQGTGGTKTTVNGIDIWKDGTPPRRFKILGIIDDERRDSLLGMMGYYQDLAKKAKAAGGDAIILVGSADSFAGLYSPNATTSYAMSDKVTKAEVIKYVK